MTTSSLAPPTQAGPVTLSVVLRQEENGPELTREPVGEADLIDAQSELWLAGLLRRGCPDVPFEAMTSRLLPLYRAEGRQRCAGFTLETTSPAGETTRCDFTFSALEPVAVRASQRLLREGTLQAGSTYYYEVVADHRPRLWKPETAETGIFKTSTQSVPLTYLTRPLLPLLEQAETLGQLDERWFHVFFTREAYQRAERLARKGGRNQPPVETGAVLIGPLCSCPDTGEMFAVVTEALEVQDAQETEFSLTYSGKSWGRIQAVLRARQAQPATKADRILGQCHGHNFLPGNGAPPCELCAKVKVCTRTSVFVSEADRTWSRAVFSRQPWQLCHIFGLNARNEEIHSLFGLRDGRLAPRGFHIIPGF